MRARRAGSILRIAGICKAHMLMTERRPVAPFEMLVEEFLRPLGLNDSDLAVAMGVDASEASAICTGRQDISAETALILARVFGNGAEFWLNTQRRWDLWHALNSPEQRARVERAQPLASAA